MRKLYENFHSQKRIVSAETIHGNIQYVCRLMSLNGVGVEIGYIACSVCVWGRGGCYFIDDNWCQVWGGYLRRKWGKSFMEPPLLRIGQKTGCFSSQVTLFSLLLFFLIDIWQWQKKATQEGFEPIAHHTQVDFKLFSHVRFWVWKKTQIGVRSHLYIIKGVLGLVWTTHQPT